VGKERAKPDYKCFRLIVKPPRNCSGTLQQVTTVFGSQPSKVLRERDDRAPTDNFGYNEKCQPLESGVHCTQPKTPTGGWQNYCHNPDCEHKTFTNLPPNLLPYSKWTVQRHLAALQLYE
jgi:hypothetical protein